MFEVPAGAPLSRARAPGEAEAPCEDRAGPLHCREAGGTISAEEDPLAENVHRVAHIL